jgi:hypothetical protein
VGIMSVVKDVGAHMDDETEPTWDEAVAALEAAEPVELVRGPREITVLYRYADGRFTATSPDVTGFKISARSLHETRSLVQHDLADFLDPAVKVVEHFPAPEPEIVTTAASCSRFELSSLPTIVVVTSCSVGRAFVSSTGPSVRRVPA